MSFPKPAFFAGAVMHRRIRPVQHRLRYRVFSVLVDLDDIETLTRRCRLFSHNRFNLLSLHDRDHADGAIPDLAWFARDLVSSRLGFTPTRVFMLAFPRVLGYVFNPLTVYFCLNEEGAVAGLIYEVNNTFGGRVHHVCRVDSGERIGVDTAAKRLLVSPFNGEHGRYGFRLKFDEEQITLGVALKDAGAAVMNASYATKRVVANDRNILWLAAAMPLMTVKVFVGIHFEALKLLLKGLRPPRPLKITLKGRHDRIVPGTNQPPLLPGNEV